MQPPIRDAAAQAALLESDDPVLAANKKLVYDMYRIVVQGGQWSRAHEFIAEGYIQHNPNVVSGRAALEDFLRNSRPARAEEATIMLPLITVIAERDLVLVVNQRPEKDDAGGDYVTTWFDLFRIEDGLIAEHWDPALKSAAMLKFDPNTKRG